MIGLTVRRDFCEKFNEFPFENLDFVEIYPEDWINIGGYFKKQLNKIVKKYPIYCHGQSLSLGSYGELNLKYIDEIKIFIEENDCINFSEHIAFSSVRNSNLFCFFPIPFSKESVNNLLDKIDKAQSILGRKIILENISYYSSIDSEMREIDFIIEIIESSGCELLLDLNSLYLNSFNNKYDPYDFINQLPLDKINYINVSGHNRKNNSLILDLRHFQINKEILKLLEFTLNKLKRAIPIKIEREYNDRLTMVELQNDIYSISQILRKKNEFQ